MSNGFEFSYWVGKVASTLVLVAPLIMNLLPHGWENITLGVVAHLALDWLNQEAHTA